MKHVSRQYFVFVCASVVGVLLCIFIYNNVHLPNMDMFSDRSISNADSSDSNSAGFWCSLSVSELNKAKAQLSEESYQVTQEEGTERPFHNPYWDHKQAGIYVDVVSGEPLFSSTDKFQSGTGWPSFTKPIDESTITKREDQRLASTRIELRSKYGDSHLGHVFSDGPAPTGKRYCINSAALTFIAKDTLVEAGYGRYLRLFE